MEGFRLFMIKKNKGIEVKNLISIIYKKGYFFCIMGIIVFMCCITFFYAVIDPNLFLQSEKGIDGYIERTEEIWNKHTYRRETLSCVDSVLSYYLMGDVHSKRVLLGKDKWLFFNSKGDITDGTLGDYTGNRSYTEKETAEICNNLESIHNYFSDKNISYAIIYGPNKSSIYSEKMPSDISYERISRTDRLFEMISLYGINAINPKEALLKNKSRYQTYYKYDTHWNEIGGTIVVNEVMKSWSLEYTELNNVNIIKKRLEYHTSAKDDLAQMIGMRELVFDDEEDYIIESDLLDWSELDSLLEKEELFNLHNDNASYDKTVFIVGDSFRVAMIPTLYEYFKDVYIGSLDELTENSIQKVEPDYMIIEVVERDSAKLAEISIR